MKDLLTLTPEEANRIECLLMVLTEDLEEHIDACDKLATSEGVIPAVQQTMRDNAQWYRECYKLLYGKEYTNP